MKINVQNVEKFAKIFADPERGCKPIYLGPEASAPFDADLFFGYYDALVKFCRVKPMKPGLETGCNCKLVLELENGQIGEVTPEGLIAAMRDGRLGDELKARAEKFVADRAAQAAAVKAEEDRRARIHAAAAGAAAGLA